VSCLEAGFLGWSRIAVNRGGRPVRYTGMGTEWTAQDVVYAHDVVDLGATESFEAFYAREMPRLVLLARALSGSASADDIAQDAMVTAYDRWDIVSRYASPGAWVRQVCANRALSIARRRAAEARALLRLGGRRQEPYVMSENAATFWAEVRRLPRRQAQAIALFYVYDLSVADIATTLGCSPGSVKVHLARGRTSLAARLGGDTEETS
jgi:RNA polymerase sigma factor (sigma-70 family)